MENTTTKEISFETQLYCARREFALRERCYPKWVDQGRMSSVKAKHELEVMAAIVETLRALVTLDEAKKISDDAARAS